MTLRLGTVYLLHFDRPYHHARHYVGFSQDLDERIKLHRTGESGAKLMRAIYKAGIGFQVARLWPNTTPRFERRAHNLVHAFICPLCDPDGAPRRARPRLSDYRESDYQPPAYDALAVAPPRVIDDHNLPF